MSCGFGYRIYSKRKMFGSVQLCVRYKYYETKKLFYLNNNNNGFDELTKLQKTFPIINRSFGNLSFSNEIKKTNILFRKHQLSCLSESFCSLKSSKENDETNETTEKQLSLYQKLKKMYREYWYVLIPVHLITSSFWFGGFYYLAASGIDIPALLESIGAPDSWVQNLKNSKAGNLVLAYTLYKVVTPIRYTITLGGTTISINYLKKYGLVKPVPNREQIKKIYQQQKGAFKDFKTSCQDKMQVTKDEFLKTKKQFKQNYKDATEELHKSLYETRTELSNLTKTAKEEHAPLVKHLKKTFHSFTGKK